ncbi:MAG: 2-phosphosulfolactate phosphatase [Candidatus Heimdallarchaeota archaeon]|nr:2-phosphosulfolactate phosphatase [Candidatus Heimdallarchaeota archaeon]
MLDTSLLAKNRDETIAVRQFVEGVLKSAEMGGISVIIDVFRASNTILALVDAGARVTPVETIGEAMLFPDHIKVGEKDGKKYQLFDFDNSPVAIDKQKELFAGKKVVVRSTNGTKGIVNALGSEAILITTFRNLSSTVDYCLQKYDAGYPISFIAMGSRGRPRIEDVYCAKMCYYEILEKIDPEDKSLKSMDNPWNGNWIQDIKDKRFNTDDHRKIDWEYALVLNTTNTVLLFNQVTFEIGK